MTTPTDISSQILENIVEQEEGQIKVVHLVQRRPSEITEVQRPFKRYFQQEILDEISEKILEKIEVIYPEHILIKGIVDIFSKLGWYNHRSFKKSTYDLIDNNNVHIPFKEVSQNKITGRFDFWIIRTYIEVGNDKFYENYLKKDVLVSKQFTQFILNYCSECFHNEVGIWTFYGNRHGDYHKSLIIPYKDQHALKSNDPNKFVMFQFKKKN